MTTSSPPSLTVPASHALTFRDTAGNLLDHPLTTGTQRHITLTAIPF